MVSRFGAISLLVLLAVAVPPAARAEQASQPGLAASGRIDTGLHHSCAIQSGGLVRCWGSGAAGELGYPDTTAIGDNEAPGSAGPVDLGEGRTAVALSAGSYHTCAVLDDASVRCWGFGGDGRLGYGNIDNIGDDETPGQAGPVNLGPGRTAKAISAGFGHSCALLDNDTIRCWGYGLYGALGYGNGLAVGDDETPGSVGPVNLGQGRTAAAISAGAYHTCALLDDQSVRCWGFGGRGRLGYGNENEIGDNETPGSVGPVNLAEGHSAKAISAGLGHTCALLDDNSLRCWGNGGDGALGYASTTSVGDDEPPGSAGPVNLGQGRTARAISAGRHTCAVLDNGAVRCWGFNRDGQLGYGHIFTIGDNETPGMVGPVNLGAGRTGAAISVSERHTCARLDDGNVRCWGYGANGRLGYCNERTIGDDETPAVAGPVGFSGPSCPMPGGSATSPPGAGPAYPLGASDPDGLEAQAARRRALSSCYTRSVRHAKRETRAARRLSGHRRAKARRHAARHLRQLLTRCLRRYGHRPGRVTGLRTLSRSRTAITLTFKAPGTDGSRPPAAHTYMVKQSRRPIRTTSAFNRARSLCKGGCYFPRITGIGSTLTVTVINLRPRTTYYYAVASRDNVSCLLGPRSKTIKVRTRSKNVVDHEGDEPEPNEPGRTSPQERCVTAPRALR